MGIILDHLMKDHGATLAEAKKALQGWEIKPIIHRDKQMGELMMKSNEVHITMLPEYRLVLGRGELLRHMLDELLGQHEFLVTRLFRGDKLKRFIEFMGFKATHADARFEYFWLDKETRNARA